MNDKPKIVIFLFALLCNFTFLATAQNPHAPTAEAMKLPECIRSHGKDSLLTRHHMAYFQENFRQGKYEEAYENWTYLFNNAPCSYKSIHQRGPQIIVQILEKTTDTQRRSRLTDTLFMIFPKRIMYFGEEALVKGYMAYYTSKYKPLELESIITNYAFYAENYEGKKDEYYIMDFMRNTVLAYKNTMVDKDVLCGVYLRLKELANTWHAESKKDDKGNSSWMPVLQYLDQVMETEVKCSMHLIFREGKSYV